MKINHGFTTNKSPPKKHVYYSNLKLTMVLLHYKAMAVQIVVNTPKKKHGNSNFTIIKSWLIFVRDWLFISTYKAQYLHDYILYL